MLQIPSNRCIHTLRKILNVAAIQSSHRDAPIHGHVNMGFFGESFTLFSLEPGETTNM